jgi:hypothetical protein
MSRLLAPGLTSRYSGEPVNERYGDVDLDEVRAWLAAEERAKGARYRAALAKTAACGLPEGVPL